eukprot:3583377-Alexandrium_andersonii.AAC.1
MGPEGLAPVRAVRSPDPGQRIELKGKRIIAKEIFAGAGRWTQAMARLGAGDAGMEELYEDP